MRTLLIAVPRPYVLCCLLLVPLAVARPVYGQVALVSGSTNFGTVSVASSSVSTLTYQFSQTFSLAQVPAVVTQGQFNADFTMTGGSCLPGTWSTNNTCTVEVTFTPAFPGTRMGAVMFVSQTGAIVSTVYLQGIGGGTLPPGTTNTTSTTTPIAPAALAVDAKENVYLTGFYKGQYGVYTVDGTALGVGAQMTTAAAIDGAGNLYVTDPLSNCVWATTPVLPLGSVSSTQRATTCLSPPTGVEIGRPLAIDGSGFVYVADQVSGTVVKFKTSGGAGTTVASCGHGTCPDSYTGQINALALDASGGLYVATGGGGTCFPSFYGSFGCNGAAWMVTPANATNPAAWSKVWEGAGTWRNLEQPASLALDAGGTVYVATRSRLYKVPPGLSQLAVSSAASGLSTAVIDWIAIDQAGNGWVADTENSKVYELANLNAFATDAPVIGQCGAANNQTLSTPPWLSSDLCAVGASSTVQGSGPWYWSCAGSQGGAAAFCTANPPSTVVNGQCGASNGTTPTASPATDLCLAGNPLPVLGSGPWTWGCTGLNGGTNAACSAGLGQGVTNGACGMASGQSFGLPPASGLCSAGTASPATLSGNGPWSWTCGGGNGGTTANCSTTATSTACAAGTVTSLTAPETPIVAMGWDSYSDFFVAVRRTSPRTIGIYKLSNGAWAFWDSDNIYGMAVNGVGDVLTTAIGFAYMWGPGFPANGTSYSSNLGGAMVAAAVDSAGNGYVSPWDGTEAWIARLTPSGGISVYAGGGTVCATAEDALGDGCQATSAVLSGQVGAMAIDSHANLYFKDGTIVRRVDHQTGIITRVAGTIGLNGYAGDGDLATKAQTGSIVGLAADDQGDIYLSQSNTNVVRRVDGTTGIITTLSVPGITLPGALTVDNQGTLYVAAQNTGHITSLSGLAGNSTNCQIVTPVAGACGAADGTTRTSAPALATDLCLAGTPYPAAGSGPWTWSCAGLNGGAIATCSAQASGAGPATPTGLSASAVSTTEVDLQWAAAAGAASYEIDRMAAGGSFTQIGTSNSPSYADTAVSANQAYLYRVRGVAGGSVSANSAVDIATTLMFTDDPLTAGTIVKAVHLAELRTAVNAVRSLAGLNPGSYTDAAVGGTTIKAVHLTELRAALDAARAALGLAANVYGQATLTGDVIKASHIQELRAGVR